MVAFQFPSTPASLSLTRY